MAMDFYFNPIRGRADHWQLQETRHTVIFENVVSFIPSPDLVMSGPRRFFYIFKASQQRVTSVTATSESQQTQKSTATPVSEPETDRKVPTQFVLKQASSAAPVTKPKTKWSKRSVASAPTQFVRKMLLSSSTREAAEQEARESAVMARPESEATLSLPEVLEPETSSQLHDSSQSTHSKSTKPRDKPYPLYSDWYNTLPEVDHKWVSEALFTTDTRGRAHLELDRIDRLWIYPPQPTLHRLSKPSLDRYFGHAPRKLWHIQLKCPHLDCCNPELTSSGVHKKTRQVIDVAGTYNIASEYLECQKCKRKVIVWSHKIISQLDVGHQIQFSCILTAQKACDMKVVHLMRQQGLGNSTLQIEKKLREQHSEEWLIKSIQYFTDCSPFAKAASSHLLTPQAFAEPQKRVEVPQRRWLVQVYIQDVLQRLDESKASITSQSGRVLKMDSTKKVVKKLAGFSAGTALWATNVGNEYGQVLISVLTAGEGYGLVPMITGLVRRYAVAQVDPPELLYVDRDCCGSKQTKNLFKDWPDLTIRLDIWHFMRRISVGCTTDSHQLYGLFMGRLGHCIFILDKEDLSALKTAKRNEMLQDLRHNPSDADVMTQISRSEIALHCRRTTKERRRPSLSSRN